MKKLLLIAILLIGLVSCANGYTPPPRIYAEDFNFNPYKGRVIRSIQYCDDCGYSGDVLIINFTDGSNLRVWAYKYNMEVYI